MELLWQFLVILLFSLMGELLHFLIPLPIPASIYGLVLMLVALCTNLVKVRQVRKVSGFLLDIMSIMFVPPAVGLIVRWADIRQLLFPLGDAGRDLVPLRLQICFRGGKAGRIGIDAGNGIQLFFRIGDLQRRIQL